MEHTSRIWIKDAKSVEELRYAVAVPAAASSVFARPLAMESGQSKVLPSPQRPELKLR